MGYFALQAKMHYGLSSAIPKDNPEYIKHEKFMQMFGEDGTMLVVGFNKENIFEPAFFKSLTAWQKKLKSIEGVTNILSVPSSVMVKKAGGDSTAKLVSEPVFADNKNFDSSVVTFLNLPFYNHLLYNSATHANLVAVYLDGKMVKSIARIALISQIREVSQQFAKENNIEVHFSGLPYIRTEFAESVRYEMKLILIASLLLTAIILFLFFRSFSAVLFSILVVFAGVLWAVGIIYLCDYKISILTALIAPL
ncbi:MAG: MMPL family transporter, partial [Chitinophagaceae bacterium]|nr:MMPL family transporter [Chitinophagaceae bacterium]